MLCKYKCVLLCKNGKLLREHEDVDRPVNKCVLLCKYKCVLLCKNGKLLREHEDVDRPVNKCVLLCKYEKWLNNDFICFNIMLTPFAYKWNYNVNKCTYWTYFIYLNTSNRTADVYSYFRHLCGQRLGKCQWDDHEYIYIYIRLKIKPNSVRIRF